MQVITNTKASSGGKGLSMFQKVSIIYLIVLLTVLVTRSFLLARVEVGQVGIRFNNVSGIYEEDLQPGYQMEVVGLHTIYALPAHFMFINYTDRNVLTVRTKDNNTVHVDVSVPYRVLQGDAWKIAAAGNHVPDGANGFRFQRFAKRAADDVLLAELARLSSEDFYNTEKRQAVADGALKALNKKLAQYHLEADSVLIRQAYFRKEYEQQLAQIQLNEQTKLLDAAKSKVATEQQRLDNYNQGTAARVAAKEQDWARKIADLERAYLVGLVDVGEDQSPGATRRIFEALSDEEKKKLQEATSKALGLTLEEVTQDHILGIKNIQAETTEYKLRINAEADGISQRLVAEGQAKIAAVQGAYEGKLNGLLDTPGGRAYVAYQAADNITFEESLVFQSSDGIPSIYRLRDFAKKLMGQ